MMDTVRYTHSMLLQNTHTVAHHWQPPPPHTSGGFATSWWLQQNLLKIVQENWSASRPEASITNAFLQADAQLLKPQGGFLGMGERGVGGSKCGASAAVAVLFKVWW